MKFQLHIKSTDHKNLDSHTASSFIHSIPPATMAAVSHCDTGADTESQPRKFSRFDFINCMFAATGGLMFGYDIGISGKQTFILFLSSIHIELIGKIIYTSTNMNSSLKSSEPLLSFQSVSVLPHPSLVTSSKLTLVLTVYFSPYLGIWQVLLH